MSSIADRHVLACRIAHISDPGDGGSFPADRSFYCPVVVSTGGTGAAQADQHIEHTAFPAPAFSGLIAIVERTGPQSDFSWRILTFPDHVQTDNSTSVGFSLVGMKAVFISAGLGGVYRWIALQSLADVFVSGDETDFFPPP